MSRRQKANAIRALSMDAVERANSGHPGATYGYGRYRRSSMERLFKF